MAEISNRQIEFVITPEHAGQRIDKALTSCVDVATRSQASRLIALGKVSLDGSPVKASHKTSLGEIFQIVLPQTIATAIVPYDFPLEIVYEDSELLVVNKPAGLVVHPACGHLQDTLVNALVAYTSDLSMGFNEQRPGLVHRIDKGTSGLLVVAKNDEAQRFLAMQFQRKTTHRIYWAITLGAPRDVTGTIRSFLRRHPDDRKRVASVPLAPEGGEQLGKLAITHYKVVKRHPAGLGLVELKLETGRTHQIRVHLSELGFSIVGDSTYGGLKRLKNVKSVRIREIIEAAGRFALHAAELGFTHPTSHQWMKFRAPWPADLKPLVEHLEFDVL